MAETSETGEKAAPRVVIKKYANRRLYNTASSSYVTLEHLSDMVKEGVDFVVYDAKTNEDITRPVLAQIIFEEESRGQNLLPIQFLRQLIRFYGDSMQSFLPSYLELSLNNFTQQQEQLRKQFSGMTPALGAPIGSFDEQIRQNMQMFDRAMKMFSPFAFTGAAGTAEPAAGKADEPAPRAAPSAPAGDQSLDELKRQMEAMRAQLDKLASKG